MHDEDGGVSVHAPFGGTRSVGGAALEAEPAHTTAFALVGGKAQAPSVLGTTPSAKHQGASHHA